MQIEQARAFMAENHRAVLATRRQSDGRPQLSPVAAIVDGEGRVVISSRETAMKVKNIRRDPAVSLCVLNDGFFGEWCQVEGQAEIVSLPDAMDALIDYYRRAAGEHPGWDDYREAMERERRVVIRFAIERAGPTQSG
jgi:PPOX class probable F420-dependent enzyme